MKNGTPAPFPIMKMLITTTYFNYFQTYGVYDIIHRYGTELCQLCE